MRCEKSGGAVSSVRQGAVRAGREGPGVGRRQVGTPGWQRGKDGRTESGTVESHLGVQSHAGRSAVEMGGWEAC